MSCSGCISQFHPTIVSGTQGRSHAPISYYEMYADILSNRGPPYSIGAVHMMDDSNNGGNINGIILNQAISGEPVSYGFSAMTAPLCTRL